MRNIPGTDLHVSPVCLGTMTFGTPVAAPDAVTLVHHAIDMGINFIDTANMYEGYSRFPGSPGGVAEEILGAALEGRRDRVVLATKVGMKVGPSDDDQGSGRKHVMREIDRSLSRMKTDFVDIYYLHKPDPQTPLEETADAFDALVRSGKIRYWGVSNFGADELQEVLDIADLNGLARPVIVQPPYSLLNRRVEDDLLPLCEREHLGVVPYRVIEGGLLTGKYRQGENAPEGSRLQEKPEWVAGTDEKTWARLAILESEARARGMSLFAYALNCLLDQPSVVSIIAGIKRTEQLQQWVGAIQ